MRCVCICDECVAVRLKDAGGSQHTSSRHWHMAEPPGIGRGLVPDLRSTQEMVRSGLCNWYSNLSQQCGVWWAVVLTDVTLVFVYSTPRGHQFLHNRQPISVSYMGVLWYISRFLVSLLWCIILEKVVFIDLLLTVKHSLSRITTGLHTNPKYFWVKP